MVRDVDFFFFLFWSQSPGSSSYLANYSLDLGGGCMQKSLMCFEERCSVPCFCFLLWQIINTALHLMGLVPVFFPSRCSGMCLQRMISFSVLLDLSCDPGLIQH